MGELRKDYILDRWVIIAEKRGTRPKQFAKQLPAKVKLCFFCPGNEKTTPPEIGRVEEKDSWKIRWFPNKFPAVVEKGDPKLKKKKFFTYRAAYGSHEVIAETPNHYHELDDLPVEHLAEVLKVYVLRIKTLSKKKNVKYVSVFKNQGADAGTSLVHTHTQIATVPMVPPLVKEEVSASIKKGKCLYCEIIRKEEKSKRKIYSSKDFISFAPFASRFSYEAWIFPRKHMRSITDMDDRLLLELAKVLKKHLVKLRSINADYNFVLHYAPKGKDLHFHIEIIPRMGKWAGFEYATDIIINSVSPESAAKFYRN